MARRLDQTPFYPRLSDDMSAGEKIRTLEEALGMIYKELSYVLTNLGEENFKGGKLPVSPALPPPYSSIKTGAVIGAGDLVIYDGAIFKAKESFRNTGTFRNNDWEIYE